MSKYSEKDSEIMSPKEEKFKEELIDKLREYKKNDIADNLKDFFLNLTRDKSVTGGVASVDADAHVINIDIGFLNGEVTKDENGKPVKPSWELITGVIKHEVLHSLLKHLYTSKSIIASELGYTEPWSADELETILKIRIRANELFKHWNAPNTFNFAGDADLARLYTEAEIEEFRKLGGIIRQDYPEFDGLSFSELCKILDERGINAEIRSGKKHYGRMKSDGTFEVDHDEDTEFPPGYNIIDPDDIYNVSAPTLKQAMDIKSLIKHNYWEEYSTMWTQTRSDKDVENYQRKVACFEPSSEKVVDIQVNHEAYAFPVISIWTLPLYDESVIEFNCNGVKFLRLPNFPTDLIAMRPIERTYFAKRGNDSRYSGSNLERVMNEFRKQIKHGSYQKKLVDFNK